MKKVIGIGGIFFKSKNPRALAEWYEKHLGVPIDKSYGGYTFSWGDPSQRPDAGYTIWSPFTEETGYLEPSQKEFMFNFIVDDLEALLEELKTEGIPSLDDIEDTEFGKFGWILDPEGHKVELWEPPSQP